MTSPREAQFQELVAEFPDSPMGHFSLGKLYLEERRYPEAVTSLTAATGLDPEYAAALVSLAEAQVGAGDVTAARATYARAKAKALEQKHAGLAEEIEGRLEEL